MKAVIILNALFFALAMWCVKTPRDFFDSVFFLALCAMFGAMLADAWGYACHRAEVKRRSRSRWTDAEQRRFREMGVIK